jgi:hypothetical protein
MRCETICQTLYHNCQTLDIKLRPGTISCVGRLRPAYNVFVVRVQPQNDSPHKRQRHTIYATETSGLLLIAFLVLVLTLIRYWHVIHWSWR